METAKYYTPNIEEFHVGFEYEMKSRFGDGTVKTLEEYNNSTWEMYTCQVGSLPYIERTMIGINPYGHPPAIRVKCLDREDIESLGWIFNDETSHYPKFYIKTANGALRALFWHKNIDDNITIDNDMPYEENIGYFNGIIKNKSELKRLMKQLGI